MPKFLSRTMTRHPLATELTAVITVKLILIILASIFLFGADQRLHLDGDTVAQKFLTPPATR